MNQIDKIILAKRYGWRIVLDWNLSDDTYTILYSINANSKLRKLAKFNSRDKAIEFLSYNEFKYESRMSIVLE